MCFCLERGRGLSDSGDAGGTTCRRMTLDGWRIEGQTRLSRGNKNKQDKIKPNQTKQKAAKAGRGRCLASLSVVFLFYVVLGKEKTETFKNKKRSQKKKLS